MDECRPTTVRWQATAETAEASAKAPELRAEERRLIELAARGDHSAFAELVRAQQRRVFSLLANVLGRSAEVEDLAQQVFLKVYQALPRFDFRASFSTWVYRIAVNEAYDHLRRRRAQKAPGVREVPVGSYIELARLAPGSEPDAARRLELRETVERLLRELPPEDRMLLLLREVEGLSIGEMAEVTGLNANTVKVRLFRARQRLLERRRRAAKAGG
jgi:RNA polymerase sigma-70 factor (ECF subfamily)